HISSCKRFAAYLKRSPDTATADEIRLFQLHLTETGASICNRNRIMTGLRFLFRHHPHRADQGTQRPPRHAVARDARSAATMVEGATDSLRYGRAARATLVVPRPQARKADDDPAAQSSVSRDG